MSDRNRIDMFWLQILITVYEILNHISSKSHFVTANIAMYSVGNVFVSISNVIIGQQWLFPSIKQKCVAHSFMVYFSSWVARY